MEKIVLLCMGVISAGYMALSMAATATPPSQVDCSTELPTLLPCLSFVQGKDQNPSAECCTGLSSMVKTSPACLCSLLSNAGNSINTTRAFEIPSKCKIRGVSASQCTGSSPPVSSGPAPAPVAGGNTPGTSEGGSPSTTPNSAVMSTPAIRLCLGLIAVCLLF